MSKSYISKMKPVDIDRLIKELCKRLPYHVICSTPVGDMELLGIHPDGANTLCEFGVNDDGDRIEFYVGETKPYLRPLSSMTHDEKEAYHGTFIELPNEEYLISSPRTDEWCNEHGFIGDKFLEMFNEE